MAEFKVFSSEAKPKTKPIEKTSMDGYETSPMEELKLFLKEKKTE
jgi:hypothetical protein